MIQPDQINPVQMAIRITLLEQLVDNLATIITQTQPPFVQEQINNMMNSYTDAYNDTMDKYPIPIHDPHSAKG